MFTELFHQQETWPAASSSSSSFLAGSESSEDTAIEEPLQVSESKSSKGLVAISPVWSVCSKNDEYSDKDAAKFPPRVNTRRLWNEIHHTAQWGGIQGKRGIARLSLSDEDRQVRDYFVREARKIGCRVNIDQMGNIFAVLKGENETIPPIGIGSHLDTQPAGGRYDGILGVLGALEVLRAVKRSGKMTYASIAAIDWTNEEGARFTPGCSGSAVWAEHTPLAEAHNLKETGLTCNMRQELQRIGYLGEIAASYQASRLSGHFELHIEQRRLLQDARKKIGIVTAIQGIRWHRVFIHGQRAHAGSTPMSQRADALVATAKIILFLETRAAETCAVATVGVLKLDRPSSNTVPGEAEFTVDLRHPSETVLDEFEAAFQHFIKGLAQENVKFQIEMKRIWQSPAVQMHETAVACTRRGTSKVVGQDETMDMISLAGHDSALAAIRVPTAMIFVPSKDGISHAPEEFTSEEECSIGVQVLLEAVLEYDSVLRSQQKEKRLIEEG